MSGEAGSYATSANPGGAVGHGNPDSSYSNPSTRPPSVAGTHRGSGGSGHEPANEFRNAPPYSPQDNFASHWSQPSPYSSTFTGANQFAAPAPPPNGINGAAHSHHGGPPGGGVGSHASPYSAFPPMSAAGNGPTATGGARPGHMSHMTSHSGGYHDPTTNAPNGTSAGQQGQAQQGQQHHSQVPQGHHYPHHVAPSPAYHSSGIAGMMPGMGAGHHQQAPHMGGHQSHQPFYSASMLAGGGMGQPHMGQPSYPSAPQYSTQLPLAGRHRVTTTLWEDEGTLCFQVDAKGVCVARRHDNSMINGTKLLNVCGMSRGKRDGILKNEKERVVVKVGAMHLKGVWITFSRGKQLADQNGITDILYPLFEPNIQSFLYHPDNYPRTQAVMAAAQERQQAREGPKPSPGNTHDSGYSDWSQHQQRAYPTNGNASAPGTVNPSPSHPHSHSGYSTPLVQGGPGTPSNNNGTSFNSSSSGGVDRRYSGPGANVGVSNSAMYDHRTGDHALAYANHQRPVLNDSPYGATQRGGPAPGMSSAPGSSQGFPGQSGAAVAARRTISGGQKRGYEDGSENDQQYGGMQQVGGGMASGTSSPSSGGDRSFKRTREGEYEHPQQQRNIYENGSGIRGGDSKP